MQGKEEKNKEKMKGEKVWEIPVKNEFMKEVEYGEKDNKTKQQQNKENERVYLPSLQPRDIS